MSKLSDLEVTMRRRFWAVRLVAGITTAIGSLILLCSLIVLLLALGILPGNNVDSRLASTGLGALVSFGLFLAGVLWVAQGQLLEVFLQIEENTRLRVT